MGKEINETLELKDLDELLVNDSGKKEKADLEVLKELFSLKDIESKTELSQDQIILFNQKRTLAKMLNWKLLDETLTDFMLLQISKDRKGRAEFVDGFKSDRENKLNTNKSDNSWFKFWK